MRALSAWLLAGGLAAGSPARAQAPGPPRFTDVATTSGLQFRHHFGAGRVESILMTTGSGCALFDYDNDGWLDAFLVNGTYLDRNGKPRKDRSTHHALFHNRGNGRFENVTRSAGVGEATYGQGCACGDYDGDGWVDLYLTNYGPNRLFRNQGDGTFRDVTARAGVGAEGWSTGAIFFDYDHDGDLDLFVANYLKFRPGMKHVHASAFSKRSGFRFFPGPRDYPAADDLLYRNNMDGTFTQVGREAGLLPGGKGLTAVAADFDQDGDQDLFVANDQTPNFFYRNDGGRFTEIAPLAGVAFDPNGKETGAMGVDVADVDGDGRQDLYVTNFSFEYNNLYRNRGKLLFDDLTRSLRLDKDNYRHIGWATRFMDFNLDGFLDCFVANGHVIDYLEGFSQGMTYRQQNMLFLGDEQGRFTNVANRCGKSFRRRRVSRGAAFGDYDNDGDIDILILNSGDRAELLRNDLPRNRRWLKIRLEGRPPNTQGIGAKVRIRSRNRTVATEVRWASSYLSSSDPTIHLGLRPGVTECAVEVLWPSGTRSSSRAVAGSMITIHEPPELNASPPGGRAYLRRPPRSLTQGW